MDTPNENSHRPIYGILRYALVLILFVVIVRFIGGVVIFGLLSAVEYISELSETSDNSENRTTAYEPDVYKPYTEETSPSPPLPETKTEDQILDDLETLFTALTVYYVLQKVDEAGRDGEAFGQYIEVLEATRLYCEAYAPTMIEYGIIRHVKEMGIPDFTETVRDDPSFGPMALTFAFACHADIRNATDFDFPTLSNPELLENIRDQLIADGVNETIILAMVNEYERIYAPNLY